VGSASDPPHCSKQNDPPQKLIVRQFPSLSNGPTTSTYRLFRFVHDKTSCPAGPSSLCRQSRRPLPPLTTRISPPPDPLALPPRLELRTNQTMMGAFAPAIPTRKSRSHSGQLSSRKTRNVRVSDPVYMVRRMNCLPQLRRMKRFCSRWAYTDSRRQSMFAKFRVRQ